MNKILILIGSSAILLGMPVSSHARSIEERLLTQSIIVQEALSEGVDPGLAIFLAAIESDLNPRAKSKVSTASGLFQWIKGSWLGICVKTYKIADEHSDVFDPVLNARCAMRTIANGGIRHWLADYRTKKKLIDNGFVSAYGLLASVE